MGGRSRLVRGYVAEHMAVLRSPLSVAVICGAAVARLPVIGAAVSVRTELVDSELVHATGSLSGELEELQLTLGEGPSMDVLAGARAILVNDLRDAWSVARWPMFGPQAIEAGGRGFFALPIRLGAIRVGVLALSTPVAAPLPTDAVADAWVLAELALEVLIDTGAAIDQLAGVPGSGRPEVHQATGMVSVQLGVGMAEAMTRLRARAFADGRQLSEIAADVVARRLRFDREDRV
ncbi:hypothetical protein [Alloactinosynnema sp. L-07]|uniref:GAF and ANTAR domain-containing protein n=1 Tax=Alloactinosynnema sp. L-07 TaxID=1653480 RepID=UPI00065F033B|nr:GAF and ANTAR domain-containing protein [Alloactinosynnema sp. L-07]CRK56604.1 hypothetical protein [Alloactinosynnema sp. L-07]